MVEYCIGVDVLGFPIYIVHFVGEVSTISTNIKKGKKFGFMRSLKHRNMQHK